MTTKNKKIAKHSDYEGFVEKFRPRLTTDDCYTPEEAYACILEHVRQQCHIAPTTRIVRPFWPGGDYKAVDYSGDCVVIDNPPFSILAEIIDHYIRIGVRFYLFAPHLTLINYTNRPITSIVCGADIIYHNGAKIKTSFVSNLFGTTKVIGDAVLYQALSALNVSPNTMPRYEYPEAVLTVSRVHKIVQQGISVHIDSDEVAFMRAMDAQRQEGKGIYGAGLLMGYEAQRRMAQAEQRAKQEAEQRAKQATYWPLSAREQAIIMTLGSTPTASLENSAS